MKTADRYKAVKSSGNTWAILDTDRGVTIMKSVTPQAAYNERVCHHIVDLLNQSILSTPINTP